MALPDHSEFPDALEGKCYIVSTILKGQFNCKAQTESSIHAGNLIQKNNHAALGAQ